MKLSTLVIAAAFVLPTGCKKKEAEEKAPTPSTDIQAETTDAAVAAEKPATPEEKALVLDAKDPGLQWGPCPEMFPEGCMISVAHGNPAEPNADVFFKVPGGYEIPSHWHTSPERMVLVSGELDVTYAGQEATTLKQGDYAYGPAKAPHGATCKEGDDCILFIAFQDPVDAFATGDAKAVEEKSVAVSPEAKTLQWAPCPEMFPEGCMLSVPHGDPSKPNADVFLKVPSKYEIPGHWHTSPERMVLVSGTLDVAYEGQDPATMETYNYAYGPAKQPHTGTCTSDEGCILFIAFQDPVDAHPHEAGSEPAEPAAE